MDCCWPEFIWFISHVCRFAQYLHFNLHFLKKSLRSMKEGMKCRILYARMRLKKLKKERKINNHPPSHFILDYSKLPEQLPAICFEWARSQWRHTHTSFWLKINEDECVVYYNAFWGSIIPQRDLRRFSDSLWEKLLGEKINSTD